MNRNVSFASLLLASIFAIDGSAASAAQAQRTRNSPASPATITQPLPSTTPRSGLKTPPPASRPDRQPPKMYPPGPSGHDTPPSQDA
jgi:hypothetical protein